MICVSAAHIFFLSVSKGYSARNSSIVLECIHPSKSLANGRGWAKVAMRILSDAGLMYLMHSHRDCQHDFVCGKFRLRILLVS